MPDEKELLERIETHERVNLKLFDEVQALKPMAMRAQVLAGLQSDQAKLVQKHNSSIADLVESRTSYQKIRCEADLLVAENIELRTKSVGLEDKLAALEDQKGALHHGYKQ